MNLVSLLFGFKGRINRAQFWFGNLGAGFAGILLMCVLGVMFMPTEEFPKTTAGFLHFLSVMGVIIGPPLFLMGWIGLALQTKRFHDRGRSGLWTMLPMLPAMMITRTIVTALAGGQTPDQALASVGVWMLVAQAVNIFMLVDLGCMPGKEEINKYGPPPGGGGGFTGAGLSSSPIPGQSAQSKAATPIPGMGLASAESAIDRAIAAREKQTQAPASKAPARSMSPAQASVASAPMRAATAGSFGRKASS